MAKCTICKSKKGKRKCRIDGTFICSLCCGQSRSQEKCDGCSFYKTSLSRRNYRKVPFYEISQMSASEELENISFVIESVICRIEIESDVLFRDKDAIQLTERWFDQYYFKDREVAFASSVQKNNLQEIVEACDQDFPTVQQDVLVKVMAAIYRSMCRRTQGRQEYLRFIRHHVGARVGSGTRMVTSID